MTFDFSTESIGLRPSPTHEFRRRVRDSGGGQPSRPAEEIEQIKTQLKKIPPGNDPATMKKAAKRDFSTENEECQVKTHEFLSGSHEFLPGCHDFLSGSHEFLSGCHDFLLGCHEFLSGCHEFLPGTHDFLLGCHDFLRECHDFLRACHEFQSGQQWTSR